MVDTAPYARWQVIAVLGAAEMMVTLDNSIVNIALPSAQADLGFDLALRSWVITAYALAFGSLLLLGGRVTDLIGRKRSFLLGLAGFAAASVLGGLSQTFAVLVTARVVQGASAALLAPAALSLLSTIFAGGRARARAFGVFATMATSGFALGMVLGGALTELLSWRWCLFVNVPIAAAALVAGAFLLPRRTPHPRPAVDVAGTVLAAAGLFCLVFGFANAETTGWVSAMVLVPLAAGVALLVAFVLTERRVDSPLLPLRIVLDRSRGGSFLATFVVIIGQFAVVLFLTYVLQQQLRLSALATGLAFLPLVAANLLASNTVPAALLPRVGPKPLVAAGLLLGACALSWLASLDVEADYLGDVLGPLVLMGLAMGTTVGTAINVATLGLSPDDSGVGSALMNAVQQLGGSLGTALLASIAGATAASAATAGSPADVAAVHGYAVAFGVGGAIFVAGLVACGLLVPAGRPGTAQSPTSSTNHQQQTTDDQHPATQPAA